MQYNGERDSSNTPVNITQATQIVLGVRSAVDFIAAPDFATINFPNGTLSVGLPFPISNSDVNVTTPYQLSSPLLAPYTSSSTLQFNTSVPLSNVAANVGRRLLLASNPCQDLSSAIAGTCTAISGGKAFAKLFPSAAAAAAAFVEEQVAALALAGGIEVASTAFVAGLSAPAILEGLAVAGGAAASAYGVLTTVCLIRTAAAAALLPFGISANIPCLPQSGACDDFTADDGCFGAAGLSG